MKNLFIVSGKDVRYQHPRGFMGARQDLESELSTIFQLAIPVDF
jgi:hypothetical protein